MSIPENQSEKKNPEKPREMSYWVVPGRFLAAEYPRCKNEAESKIILQKLIDFGINHFIDLTEPTANDRPDGHLEPYQHILDQCNEKRDDDHQLRRSNFPIKDGFIPKTYHEMDQILDQIDQFLCQGDIIYLHCWGGVGRTGTVVDCWLHRHLNGLISNHPDINHFHPNENPPPKNGFQLNLLDLWCTNPKAAQGQKTKTIQIKEIQQEFVQNWTEQDSCVQDKAKHTQVDISMPSEDLETQLATVTLIELPKKQKQKQGLQRNLVQVLHSLQIASTNYLSLSALILNRLNQQTILKINGNLRHTKSAQNMEISIRNRDKNPIVLVRLFELEGQVRPTSYLIAAFGICQIEGL